MLDVSKGELVEDIHLLTQALFKDVCPYLRNKGHSTGWGVGKGSRIGGSTRLPHKLKVIVLTIIRGWERYAVYVERVDHLIIPAARAKSFGVTVCGS